MIQPLATWRTTVANVEKFVASLGGAQQLARKIGISHQAVYKWCKEGVIPEGSAYKIAHLCGLPTDDVLKYSRRPKAA